MRFIFALLVVSIFCLSTLAQQYKPSARRYSTVTTTNIFSPVSGNAYAYTITAFNHHTADLYLHVFDTNAIPAAGTRPVLPAIRIPANSTGGYDFQPNGCDFRWGITVAPSTTPTTFTNASTVFDISVTVHN